MDITVELPVFHTAFSIASLASVLVPFEEDRAGFLAVANAQGIRAGWQSFHWVRIFLCNYRSRIIVIVRDKIER